MSLCVHFTFHITALDNKNFKLLVLSVKPYHLHRPNLTCMFICCIGNCTCDVTTDIGSALRIVCVGPSTAPCVCTDTDCKVH